jgi:nucleoside-diphosphate-sugar epimerase
VAIAKLSGTSDNQIWGDGEQTRSFCYIDDCVTGIYNLMRSDYHEPLNLGQDRLVSINQLADMVAGISGVEIVKRHVAGPRAYVAATLTILVCVKLLRWEPQISLELGLERTYAWIQSQVRLLQPL